MACPEVFLWLFKPWGNTQKPSAPLSNWLEVLRTTSAVSVFVIKKWLLIGELEKLRWERPRKRSWHNSGFAPFCCALMHKQGLNGKETLEGNFNCELITILWGGGLLSTVLVWCQNLCICHNYSLNLLNVLSWWNMSYQCIHLRSKGLFFIVSFLFL